MAIPLERSCNEGALYEKEPESRHAVFCGGECVCNANASQYLELSHRTCLLISRKLTVKISGSRMFRLRFAGVLIGR